MAEKKERTPAQKAAQFKPGKSGNPKGRTPDVDNVTEYAKQFTRLAIDALVKVILTSKNPTSVVNASNVLLNRGWGAPKQTVDVDVTHKQDWSALLNALDAHNAAKALSSGEAVIEGNVIEEIVPAEKLPAGGHEISCSESNSYSGRAFNG